MVEKLWETMQFGLFFDSGLWRLELLVSLTPFILFYLFLFLVDQLFVKMMLDVMGKR